MTENPPFSLSLRRSETKSLRTETQNRLCAGFRRGARTSPMEPLNAPCNRCGEWRACTWHMCATRLDQCFFRAHHGGHGRCVTQTWTYNRFHIRADTGTKTYSKTRLKVYAQPGAHLQVSHTQFLYGCWLGRDSPTDKHTVESKAGVFRARAVRRSTEDRSWSADTVTGMEWTLWRTAETTRGRPPRA